MRIESIVLAALAAMAPLATVAQNKPLKVIQHVEPRNWWVGMHNQNLQVLVHAQGIAETTPRINYDGVRIASVVSTTNPNYLFLNLCIAPTAQAGDVKIEFVKAGKVVSNYMYALKEREDNSANRVGFSSEDAVYLLMADRFANGDVKNDDMPGMVEKSDRNAPYGRHGGDLRGVMDHLDYISDLGMTALWMTPVLENNMPNSSYHGYAITDYSEVDARLGTLDEYKELVGMCHQRGMKVIMDMVFNHCGTNHWWMKDLPCEDWVFQWGGKAEPTRSSYRLSTVADPHVSAYDLRQATEGWFDSSMADMNLGNELVKNYFIQNSIWWIETVGLDGIRQDTYPYSEKNAMREWNLRVREEYPQFNIVGEAWISQPSKLCYWQKDAPNADGYNSELPTIMDFPMMDAIGRAFNEEPSWDGGMMRLYDVLASDYIYPNTQNILVFGENHDAGRLFENLQHDVDKLKMALAFIATVRGIPQLYVGTEVLMDGNGAQHSEIRKDFPGGWKGDKIDFFNNRTGQQAEVHDYMAKLFNYRKTSEPLKHGTLKHFLPVNEVYVYFRTCGDKAVMVVINNAASDQKLDAERYGEELSKYNKGVDVVGGKAVDLGNMIIRGKSALVVELN